MPSGSYTDLYRMLFYFISKDKTVYAKLRAEIDQALAGKELSSQNLSQSNSTESRVILDVYELTPVQCLIAVQS